MNLLHTYQNGNVLVKIHEDGTLIREWEDKPEPEFPCSIDLKITNWCNAPCQKWCHEKSNLKGEPAELWRTLPLLRKLPAGVEIAVGGGATQSHPKLNEFLETLRGWGLVPNITLNHYHLETDFNACKKAMTHAYGVGISYQSGMDLRKVKALHHDNVVFHFIAGIHTPQDYEVLCENFEAPKLLILGYKKFGNGVGYFTPTVEAQIETWVRELPKYLGKFPISFDNLALEQLQVQRLVTEKAWNEFYMGDDGSFTMYVDAVKTQYARSSTSEIRYGYDKDSNLKMMFQKVRLTDSGEI